MFINRRLYQFEPDPLDPEQGQLILGDRVGKARKTGRTRKTFIFVDTMTGRKQVEQFHDEFVALEPAQQLGGESDRPEWTHENPTQNKLHHPT